MSSLKIELVLDNIEKLGNNVVIRIDGNRVDIKSQLVETQGGGDFFFPFMETLIAFFTEAGSMRTAETYRYALNSFRNFRNDEDIEITEITHDITTRYEKYLRHKGLSINTISFHMRIMRAAYNKAVSKGMTVDTKPFKNVYTGIPRTAKRAISIQYIRNIRKMESGDPALCYARDMFLFSFYTRGMSFVDMAYLKKTDIKNGWLQYKRHKTGQTIMIKWEQCMQDIVDRFSPKNNVFLLPIIHSVNGKERNQYRNKQNEINKQLKAIAHHIGLDSNLTMYVARHTWANMAKEMNTPLDIISGGMGHTSIKTTKIYLKSLNLDKIDKVNAHIIKMIQ